MYTTAEPSYKYKFNLIWRIEVHILISLFKLSGAQRLTLYICTPRYIFLRSIQCLTFFKDTTMTGYLAFLISRYFATMAANTMNSSSSMASPKWLMIRGSITALMLLLATF